MPSTTNFGWTTPADTDLVKDGASAIRTLGNGIDASLVDLKGGTTGQVLSKNSNTDLDYAWVTPNVGDITEIQAGTGISVTSGTGPIPTIALSTPIAATNGGTAQSTYATGDLLYASASNTLSKRTIGSTGDVLTVSGGVPTWAAPTGGSFSGCALTASAQSINNNTTTIVTFGTELFDTDNFHSTSTNTGRITVPSGKDGKYLLSFILQWQTPSATGRRYGGITYYNSSSVAQFSRFAEITPNGTSYPTLMGSAIINAVAGDYFVIEVNQGSGSAMDIQGNFDAAYLGA